MQQVIFGDDLEKKKSVKMVFVHPYFIHEESPFKMGRYHHWLNIPRN